MSYVSPYHWIIYLHSFLSLKVSFRSLIEQLFLAFHKLLLLEIISYGSVAEGSLCSFGSVLCLGFLHAFGISACDSTSTWPSLMNWFSWVRSFIVGGLLECCFHVARACFWVEAAVWPLQWIFSSHQCHCTIHMNISVDLAVVFVQQWHGCLACEVTDGFSAQRITKRWDIWQNILASVRLSVSILSQVAHLAGWTVGHVLDLVVDSTEGSILLLRLCVAWMFGVS